MKDIDSFYFPLAEELCRLAYGVRTYDASKHKFFTLRVHLIMLFGDMPAVAKLMNLKGHNGNKPCRMCEISSVRYSEGNSRAGGVPLDRRTFPSPSPPQHNPLQLPLRSHISMLADAEAVACAETNAEAGWRATQSGINGISIWRHFGSVIWPTSFPLDFMHLVFENVVPLLLDLWLGTSKHCREGDDFTLPPAIASAVAEQVSKSGQTIPGAFGRRVPHL
ncbi:hypothetical protein CALVIDRAFT_489781, partial [Calocera viscosa TUFC12733]